MIKLKNNKGITLVALIITVILMLILVSVATYSGINTYNNTEVTKFVAQMQLIQTKIDGLVEENNIENIGEEITTDETKKNIIDLAYTNGEIQSNTDEYKNKFKYISRENLELQLDIADIEDDVLVNFETREVISISGVEYGGKKYYTQYKLPNGQTLIYNESVERNLTFNLEISVDGLNSTVSISNISINNGTLSFAETDSEGDNRNWKTITNYTEKEKVYTANISKSGNYTFKLQDNTDIKNTWQEQIVITLTNKPNTNLNIENYNYEQSSDKWAYIEISGTTYLWIPRFVYNSDNQIKFVKGNSRITTDETYIGDDWTTHSKFTDNGTELTGIWVETSRQAGLNMIELLNSESQTLKEINE